MEMTIHRALLELKTLKKRIEKEISGAEFITCVKGRADKINGVPRKEVEAKYQSNYDTIVGLISNYEKIKTAVIRSNAGLQGEARTVIVNGSAYTVAELKALGFAVLDSSANFIFATHPKIDGKEMYLTLKANGILVRHFDKPALCQYNRVTIGTREQMETFIEKVRTLWEDVL